MEVHGRVFALDETLRSWSMAIATGTAGFAFSHFGYRNAGLMYGSLPVIGAILLLVGIRRSHDNDSFVDDLSQPPSSCATDATDTIDVADVAV